MIGAVRLDRLKPADVTRVLLAMEGAGKASSTRRNTYAALRGALDDAVRNGLLASNPVTQVKRPRNDHREALVLTPKQVPRFLTRAEGLRYVVALKVILGTGLRRGEVLALRWDEPASGGGRFVARPQFFTNGPTTVYRGMHGLLGCQP